jgi:hypothetical protein
LSEINNAGGVIDNIKTKGNKGVDTANRQPAQNVLNNSI